MNWNETRTKSKHKQEFSYSNNGNSCVRQMRMESCVKQWLYNTHECTYNIKWVELHFRIDYIKKSSAEFAFIRFLSRHRPTLTVSVLLVWKDLPKIYIFCCCVANVREKSLISKLKWKSIYNLELHCHVCLANIHRLYLKLGVEELIWRQTLYMSKTRSYSAACALFVQVSINYTESLEWHQWTPADRRLDDRSMKWSGRWKQKKEKKL